MCAVYTGVGTNLEVRLALRGVFLNYCSRASGYKPCDVISQGDRGVCPRCIAPNAGCRFLDWIATSTGHKTFTAKRHTSELGQSPSRQCVWYRLVVDCVSLSREEACTRLCELSFEYDDVTVRKPNNALGERGAVLSPDISTRKEVHVFFRL